MKIKLVSLRQWIIVGLMALVLVWSPLLWIVFRRIPYWRLELVDLIPALSVGALVFLLGSLAILRVSRFGLIVWWSLGAMSAVALFSISFLYRNPNLGFLTIGWCAYVVLLGQLYSSELQRSFWPPRVPWFQGHSLPLSNLAMTLLAEPKIRGRLSRIDGEGFFAVLAESDAGVSIEGDRTFVARVEFRGDAIELPGRISCIDRSGRGLGLRFEHRSPDAAKDVSDFVEKIRSESPLYV